MLSVFALDPKIGLNIDQFLRCTEHCHPSQGRLIADLPPGLWLVETSEIINQSENRPIRKRRLKRILDKMRAQLVDRPGTDWDFLESSWITNTEKEHQRDPFSLIISPDYNNADDQELKYPPSELDSEVKAWNTPNGISITRSPRDFVKAILPMLRLAKEIHFVDRYFNVEGNSLYTQNYKQIIDDLAKYHNSFSSFPSLTIHCCPELENYGNYLHNFGESLNEYYALSIPTGKSIKVFLWKTEFTPPTGGHPFHNRYVLSDHCGVIVGYGTDSTRQETDAPDTLQIVDEKIYKDIWKIRKEKWPPGAEIKERFEISS